MKRKNEVIYQLYKGDKVMQTENNYELNVMNGDTGRILRGDETLTVDMSGREVEYGPDDLWKIRPAYAITIHKSQGSEYPAVIIPVVSAHQFMLGRNLLYTAITRGRQHVFLVGDDQAFLKGISSTIKDFRYTMLQQMV